MKKKQKFVEQYNRREMSVAEFVAHLDLLERQREREKKNNKSK